MKVYFFIIGFIISFGGFSQTGIGTTTPHVSAKLDVSATNKGFLPPRIALLSINDVATIASPATGLVIFNTATAGASIEWSSMRSMLVEVFETLIRASGP